jgi:hypothetical protein
MRKMGWSEGSGLGKKNQGISVPIEVCFEIDYSLGCFFKFNFFIGKC